MPPIGSPSGVGRWGILDIDEDGRLACHECGRTYLALGVHIAMTHEMTARDYRLAHGLTMSTPLVAEALRVMQAERMRTPQAIARIAATRSPDTLAVVPQDIITRGLRISRASGESTRSGVDPIGSDRVGGTRSDRVSDRVGT